MEMELDHQTAEHFAKTINALKGKVTLLFIAHQLPKGLQIDGIVRLGPQGQGQPSHAGGMPKGFEGGMPNAQQVA